MGVDDINLSDHSFILCSWKRVKLIKKKCNIIGRSYGNNYADLSSQNMIDSEWTEYDANPMMTGKWVIYENIIRTKFQYRS